MRTKHDEREDGRDEEEEEQEKKNDFVDEDMEEEEEMTRGSSERVSDGLEEVLRTHLNHDSEEAPSS